MNTITPITQNYMTYSPTFKANPMKKVRYAAEYIDCAVQKNYPPPTIYRQLLPIETEKAPFDTLLLKSGKPTEDLKEIYEMYKEDFSDYHNYLSYKKFKNNLHYDNATVFMLKSGKETVGFYSLSLKNNETLYVNDVDLAPKYRNTRTGKDIIITCWDNINKLAKENKCSKIGLHVDADKKYLVNLYKKLGFEINKTDKYSTGKTAYYMERGGKYGIDTNSVILGRDNNG